VAIDTDRDFTLVKKAIEHWNNSWHGRQLLKDFDFKWKKLAKY
jgi:hypothetical protein